MNFTVTSFLKSGGFGSVSRVSAILTFNCNFWTSKKKKLNLCDHSLCFYDLGDFGWKAYCCKAGEQF